MSPTVFSAMIVQGGGAYKTPLLPNPRKNGGSPETRPFQWKLLLCKNM